MVNVLNRLQALLLELVVLAAALVAAGLATGVLAVSRVHQVWPYAPVEAIAHDVAKLGPIRTPYTVAVALIVALLALLLLVRELSPPPRRARTLLLPKGGQGRTEVSYSALDDLAAHSAESVAGIERVRARVDPGREALTVRCRALISPYAELSAAGPAIEHTVKERLERLTGMPVREVRVRATLQDDRAHRTVR